MPTEICPDCKHSQENNLHGFDQNDAWLEDDPTSESGYRLVHSGSCTYCRFCNPGLFEAVARRDHEGII